MTHETFTFGAAQSISAEHYRLSVWIEERMRERLQSFYLLDSFDVFTATDGEQRVSVYWTDRWDESSSEVMTWEELTDLDAWKRRVERLEEEREARRKQLNDDRKRDELARARETVARLSAELGQ